MKFAFQVDGEIVIANVIPRWQLPRSGRPVVENATKVLQGIRPKTERCITVLHDAAHVRLTDTYGSLSTCLERVLVSGRGAQCDVVIRCPCLECRRSHKLRCIVHPDASYVQPGHP
eukprot:948191-Rhodomonas_salina.1